MQRGAIILCGGKSTRMGRDKATLPFGPSEVLLQRVVRLLSEVVEGSKIVAVASRGQQLPRLPRSVRVAEDQHPERGPLEGLAAGLVTIGDRADAVYVTSCDVPLLQPAFVSRLFGLLEDGGQRTTGQRAAGGQSRISALRGNATDGCQVKPATQIVVPRDAKHHHPLAAVYRTNVLSHVNALLAEDRLRPVFLFDSCRTLEVSVDDLRDVDPNLLSLLNCNRPDDYRRALTIAGLDTHVR